MWETTVGVAAHPRSRGENCSYQFSVISYPGSSPLTRGKRFHITRLVGEKRLIPAHAGKTGHVVCPAARSRAHPRSRGENHPHAPSWPRRRGSSPLTRGKRRHRHSGERRNRLIPAHAGKTLTGSSPHPSATAHPRSRGENDRLTEVKIGDTGSSPLTRGKPPLPVFDFTGVGLIPAHAGKTRACS